MPHGFPGGAGGGVAPGFPGVDPNQPDGIENGAGAEDGVEALPAVPRLRPLPPAEGATTESSPVRPALPGLAPAHAPLNRVVLYARLFRPRAKRGENENTLLAIALLLGAGFAVAKDKVGSAQLSDRHGCCA